MGKRQCALFGITQASVVSDQFLAQVHDVNVPRSACAPGSGMRSTGSTRIISTGKTCKAFVVSILVPQERLGVDDLPTSANLG